MADSLRLSSLYLDSDLLTIGLNKAALDKTNLAILYFFFVMPIKNKQTTSKNPIPSIMIEY